MPLRRTAGFSVMRGGITQDRGYRSMLGRLEDWPEVSDLVIAHLSPAPGSTILDAEAQTGYYVP